ncbi:MAG: hypothetical protein HY973_03975 [Candidatus Kerfeldbacteria bacterium]|nr:hypothetical protein [Candidatus Kerfeldbacteria bacterium]
MVKLKVIYIQRELVKHGLVIFSVNDFSRIFKVKQKTARAFLSYNLKKKVFLRMKRGIYIYSANPPTKFEIANYLWKPSYITFETALSFHGIIPETVYTITSATTRSSREFNFENQIYKYYQIKKNLFFGYKPIKIRDKIVLIADKEKALLDYLYLASLKKRLINERLDLKKIDKKRLGRYLNYFIKNIRKSKPLINLIKNLDI